jgi:protein involved in polysaccharide export with SLBB domain
MASASASAQTPEQLELLRQNPELVRERIGQSGLTADEIRSRLRAAGYPANMLDAYLSDAPLDAASARVTEDMLGALEMLGVPVVAAEGLEEVPRAIGMQLTPQRAEGALELPLFGIEVFQSRGAQFQPLLSGPVPPNYRLGPGDVLVLVVTGDVELIQELAVTREGFVVIPQVGQLFVNNLTMEQLNALLRQRLGRSYSGIRTGSTRFDVTVARLRTNQVYVVGEVVQPSAYQLSSVATVLNALYAAGGPTERANFRDVQVRRRGDTVAVFDLYDYLLGGDTRNDVMLEQGDVVFVPVRGARASITGAVVRPALYELSGGETLADLVRMAGGLLANAETRRVTVHRVLPAARREAGPMPRMAIDVPLAVANGEDEGSTPTLRIPALTLEDGDSVAVDSVIPIAQSLYVWITGLVHKPGQYLWSEGMTLRDLMLLARGPRVGADLREALIARLPPDQSEGTLSSTLRVPLDSTYLFERDSSGRYFGPPGLPFPGPGTAPEVVLQPYDAVTIFKQPEFEFQRAVMITGEVLYPGVYALERKTERLSDLVRRAGGLTRTAYIDGARFYRDQDDAGRVNVRLDMALAHPGGPEDIVLQPMDSISVPEYIPTVRVQGAVINPTSVMYSDGAELEYYVANAGGYARNADKGRVSVQYANGSAEVKQKFLFLARSPKPGPGSVVTVPGIPEGEGLNVNQLLGTVAQVLTSAVAIIAIVVK